MLGVSVGNWKQRLYTSGGLGPNITRMIFFPGISNGGEKFDGRSVTALMLVGADRMLCRAGTKMFACGMRIRSLVLFRCHCRLLNGVLKV